MPKNAVKLLVLLTAAVLLLSGGTALAKKDFHGWAMDKLMGWGCTDIEYTMYEARDAFKGKATNPLPFMDLDILDVSEGDRVTLVKWEPSKDRYKLIVKRQKGGSDSVIIGRNGKKKDSGLSLKFD